MIFSHIISIYLLFLSYPALVTLYLSYYSSVSILLLLFSSLIDTSYRIPLMLMFIFNHIHFILLLLCFDHYCLLCISYFVTYLSLFFRFFHLLGFILLNIVVSSMRSFNLLLSDIPIFYLMRSQLSSSIATHQLVLIYSLLLYRTTMVVFLTLTYFVPFCLFSHLLMFSFDFLVLLSVASCFILIFYLFLIFFIWLRIRYLSTDLIHESFQYVNFHLCQQVIAITSFNQDWFNNHISMTV